VTVRAEGDIAAGAREGERLLTRLGIPHLHCTCSADQARAVWAVRPAASGAMD
jgi:hypothetical protein